MPLPVSAISKITFPSAQFAVEIVMLHGRSVTSAIASIAFITRLSSTCWICTLSPMIKLS